MSGMAVKIPRLTLINELKKKLKEIEKENEAARVARDKYEEEVAAIAFVEKVYPKAEDTVFFDAPYCGGITECIIGELLMNNIYVSFDLDQWWGVESKRWDVEKQEYDEKTFVQADTMLLGLVETYRWWQERFKMLAAEERERQPEGSK